MDENDKEQTKSGTISCSPCSGEESIPAVAYCNECEEYLCDKCVKRHKERRAFRDHAPMDLKEYQSILSSTINPHCDLCKDKGVEIPAVTVCDLCEEKLCEKCTEDHKKRKITKDHVLIPISEKIEKEIALNIKTCMICKDFNRTTKAEFYCHECDEYLCTGCHNSHERRRATRNHKTSDAKEVNDCHSTPQFICDECNEERKISEATQFCNECQEYLCLICIKRHKSRRITKSHTLIEYEDGDAEPCGHCETKFPHKSAFYCNQCLDHLCQECTRKHKTHKKTESHELICRSMYLERKKDAPICTTCNLQNCHRESISFCNVCDEYLCEKCDKQHKIRKATKDHKIILLDEIDQEEKHNCDLCSLQGKEVRADSFCEKCEEFLCKTCAQLHSFQKATKTHTIENIVAYQKRKQEVTTLPCDVCGKQNAKAIAKSYCKICSENLCESCSGIHQIQTATKDHKLQEIDDTINLSSEKSTSVSCSPCLSKGLKANATTHCINCKEDFCERCTNVHKKIPGAELHGMIEIEKWMKRLLDTTHCSQCSQDDNKVTAITFCEICNQHLCKLCTEAHQSLGFTKKHSLKSIEVMAFSGAQADVSTHRIKSSQLFSNIKTYKEKDFPELSAPVQEDVTTSTITVSWKNPPKIEYEVKYFEVQYRTAMVQKAWTVSIANGNQNSHTVKNLTSDTPYEFQIRAKYDREDNVYGPLSPISAHITTLQVVSGKPTLVDAAGDRITISWNIDKKKKPSISCYEIRYRKTGETKWQVTSTDDSNERCTVEGLQGNTTYEFKVRPIYDDGGEGPYGPVSDQITTKTPHPGKPELITAATDSITIKWKTPEGGALLIKHYTIRFRKVGDDVWQTKSTKNGKESETVGELKGSTKYEFQVRTVYEDMEGPYGPTSDHIETETTLARQVLKVAEEIPMELDAGEPMRFKVPIKIDKKSENPNAKYRRCIFALGVEASLNTTLSHASHLNAFFNTLSVSVFTARVRKEGNQKPGIPEKTIMLVGATGSGKSTLIDGMMNYLFDVSWDDEFRYNLIDLTQEEASKVQNQALSQTEWITNYRINHTDGSQIMYTLNIVDTPGFGDTRGIARDKKIVDQMRELFSIRNDRGISTIDAVCFVTQAPLARLSPTQKYIFESILSLFGKDIKDNIFILITFADGNKPPVLDALKNAEVPYVQKFVFNNSALFAPRQAEFASMFWKMGRESFKKFFSHLAIMKTRSLVMTADVLKERNHLETTVQGLRPRISDGLNKLETLRQTKQILKQHKTDIKANKNFNYEVKEIRQRKIDLDAGIYVTNCVICNKTCHYPCAIPNNEDKKGCAAMKGGQCKVCPKNCNWDSHRNNEFRIDTYPEMVTKTYEELKKKYENATGKAQTSRQLFQSIKNDFNALQMHVGKMIEEVKRSLNRLSEIALKPNPLSNVEYIDLLIETEKQEGKEGFQGRISVLSNLRKDAEIIERVPDGEYEPWGECTMSDLEDDDDDDDDEDAEAIERKKKKKGKWEAFTSYFSFSKNKCN